MSTLSEAELARIAKNRERARNIKSSKLCHHPYSRQQAQENGEQTKNETTTKRYNLDSLANPIQNLILIGILNSFRQTASLEPRN